METLIPSPAACRVLLLILNAQSIVPIEIHRQLCHLYEPKLTPEHKIQCSGVALTFLLWYHDDEFLDRIVAGNEPGISHFTLETKQQSMYWHPSGSSVRTQFKQMLLIRKGMCTVFWDRKAGSVHRRQSSTTEGYKSGSHNTTSVSILVVAMLKNSCTVNVASKAFK